LVIASRESERRLEMSREIGILKPESDLTCPLCGKPRSNRPDRKRRFYLCGTEVWQDKDGDWRALIGERCKG